LILKEEERRKRNKYMNHFAEAAATADGTVVDESTVAEAEESQ